mmetsp:Transcript_45765/g.127389  ORF Transcript_45765/g.127389 Transcript_45765/m.127389 type:complete len:97 (+) Transcript_45765:155-445(+)
MTRGPSNGLALLEAARLRLPLELPACLCSSSSPKHTEDERDERPPQAEAAWEGERVEASSSPTCDRSLAFDSLLGSQGLGILGGLLPPTVGAAWTS